MRKLLLVFALLGAACHREPDAAIIHVATTDTTPPPPGVLTGTRYARTSRRVNPAGWEAGSPPPLPEPRRENDVLITGNVIEVRPMLPRKRISLRVRNMTEETHELSMRGGGDEVTLTIGPSAILPIDTQLGEGTYELVCTLPGHFERGRFETFPPIR